MVGDIGYLFYCRYGIRVDVSVGMFRFLFRGGRGGSLFVISSIFLICGLLAYMVNCFEMGAFRGYVFALCVFLGLPGGKIAWVLA